MLLPMSGDVDNPPLADIDLLGLVIVNPMSNFVMVDGIDSIITIIGSSTRIKTLINHMLITMLVIFICGGCLEFTASTFVDKNFLRYRFVPCGRIHDVVASYTDLLGLVHVLPVALFVYPVMLWLGIAATRSAAAATARAIAAA